MTSPDTPSPSEQTDIEIAAWSIRQDIERLASKGAYGELEEIDREVKELLKHRQKVAA